MKVTIEMTNREREAVVFLLQNISRKMCANLVEPGFVYFDAYSGVRKIEEQLHQQGEE